MTSKTHYSKKGNLFSTVAKLCFVAGALSFIPIARLRDNTLLWIWTLGLMFVLAPVLGIVGNIISIRRGQAKHKWWVLTVILLEGLVLFIFGPWIVPCFYTTPTFSSRNIELYEKFITFTKSHQNTGYIRLDARGWLDWRNGLYFLYDPLTIDRLGGELTPKEVDALCEIWHRLEGGGIVQVRLVEGIVLFVAEAAYRKPVLYGAAYSLSGENPNDLQNDELRYFGPYTEIAPRWYTSKNLRLRERILSPIINPPKSLIDRSLSILPEELDALEEP